MDISDFTLIVLCCYQKCPLPLDKWENWEARLTDDWGRGGWWIVGEIAAAEEEEEEISDMRKRARARAREKEILQPLHCSLQTFTGSAIWKKKRRSVCAQWQRASVRYREVFVLKRKRRPLVSDIKQPRTLAEKRPCTIPCETLLSRMCGLHFNLVA